MKKLTVPKSRRVVATLTVNPFGRAPQRFESPTFSAPVEGESNDNLPPFSEWEELQPEPPFDWKP